MLPGGAPRCNGAQCRDISTEVTTANRHSNHMWLELHSSAANVWA